MANERRTIYDDIYEELRDFYCPEEMKNLTIDEASGLREYIEDRFDSFMADMVNAVKKADYFGHKWD